MIENIFIFVNVLVPSDGIPKGKTWGPSTLHSRERSHLPAMTQTSSQEPTEFSKSAPNLDKSRNTAGNNLTHATNASSSHNNILGKSVDGLNLTQADGANKKYNNSTELGSVDRLNNNNTTNNDTNADNMNGDRFIIYDDDDDDDTERTPGCFSFMGRSDDSHMKRKKHSLDSRMADALPENALQIAVKTIGLPAYSSDMQHFDGHNMVEMRERSNEATPIRNADDAPYDRVFYRTIQKSLDDIFSRDDFNREFTPQESRHSKSSADLTMYSDYEHHYRFEPFVSSKFERKCFFVNNIKADQDVNGNDSPSDIDDFNSSNFELSAKSNESTSENISSSMLQTDSDQFADSSASNNPYSTSRKSSVTFRVDSIESTQPFNTPPQELFYANIVHGAVRDSLTNGNSLNNSCSNRTSSQYTPISDTNSFVSPDNTTGQSKRSSKFKAVQRFWRSPRGNSVLHSNSFYKKQKANDMNQQLLDEENDSYPNSLNSAEPKYKAFRTTNFLLAKQNDS